MNAKKNQMIKYQTAKEKKITVCQFNQNIIV